MMLRKLLTPKETRDIELDDPLTTQRRRDLLEKNQLLKSVYDKWYQMIIDALPDTSGGVLEIGTGAGFLKKYFSSLIASEIFWLPGMDVILNGQEMACANSSLRAIVMTNVLHHFPDVTRFFSETRRCLVLHGRLIMIEPWLTSWSRLIYRYLHHEPMDPDTEEWSFPPQGPLSGANEALPWIIFERDRKRFEQLFPDLRILQITPLMPIRYLVTGGFSSRVYPPGWTASFWDGLEILAKPWHPSLGMFAYIVLEKGQ